MARSQQEWTKATKLTEQPGNSQDSRVNPLMNFVINDYDGEEGKRPERIGHLSAVPQSDSNLLSSNDAESA